MLTICTKLISTQSFHQVGFAATQVFERAGPIIDPMYHNSGDVSKREGYDLEQVRSIAKVQVRVTREEEEKKLKKDAVWNAVACCWICIDTSMVDYVYTS